ncbi:unnamed protein product [Phytophthora fragariaefolia]|uniref:Unnamed protein product n=1 Tax=Phytophthora fragariaefolia TaxID=1490495 RepID=A0A9W6XXV5_9STRA|nr:unnamed protein product [Phytophthora fragariaefolia]
MASSGSASEYDNEPAEDQSPEVHILAPRAGFVRTPRMVGEVFENWDAFFEHLHVFQEEIHQIYKKRTSTSSAARNADHEQRGKATPPNRDARIIRQVLPETGMYLQLDAAQSNEGQAEQLRREIDRM